MSSCSLLYSILLVILFVICALGDEHQHPNAQNPLHDSKHVHNKEHIKEHLKEEIDVKDENLNDEDLQFHYFKLHDADNNNKLDGIELMNALTHYHDDENSKNEEQKTYSDDEIATMIDQILDEDDKDKDGYINYAEFAASQKS